MSSAGNIDSDASLRCANCGAAESDDIKLKTCTACKSVRYCSVKCQKEHRPKHKKECKKRAAELRDEILFQQPESSNFGDCPICCLPLSLDPLHSTMMNCCSKLICNGCAHNNRLREMQGKLERKCPFCRRATPKSDEEIEKNFQNRVDANDPIAMCQLGKHYYNNKGDSKSAYSLWKRAAELGDSEAHFSLATLYRKGIVVAKDQKKERYHYEEAVIGGDVDARYGLGHREWLNGRPERAVKHFIIAASMGYDMAMNQIKKIYSKTDGLISKEDFAKTLRAHQASVDATRSPDREKANAFIQMFGSS